jgi:glutathione S-transferase
MARCDDDFKPLLDRYKYADRHPDLGELEHRQVAEGFVRELDELLAQSAFLGGDRYRLVDVAVFPFIRQFAGVDGKWFESCEYRRLRDWLNHLLGEELFRRVMGKHPFWQPGDEAVFL